MTPPLRSREDLVAWIDACVLIDLWPLLRVINAFCASPDQVTTNGKSPLDSARGQRILMEERQRLVRVMESVDERRQCQWSRCPDEQVLTEKPRE